MEKRGNSPGRRKECWQRHAPNVANRSATPGNQKRSDTATPRAWRISQPRKEGATRAEEPERTGRGVLEDEVAPQGATAGWGRPRLETWRRERHAQAPRGEESREARRRRGGYRDGVYATWRTAQVGTPRGQAWRFWRQQQRTRGGYMSKRKGVSYATRGRRGVPYATSPGRPPRRLAWRLWTTKEPPRVAAGNRTNERHAPATRSTIEAAQGAT